LSQKKNLKPKTLKKCVMENLRTVFVCLIAFQKTDKKKAKMEVERPGRTLLLVVVA
jgi:hypothetical protein